MKNEYGAMSNEGLQTDAYGGISVYPARIRYSLLTTHCTLSRRLP